MFAEDIRQLPPVGFFPKDFDFLYRRLFKTHWKCSLHSGSFYFLRKYCLLFKLFERKWSCSIDVVGKMKWTLEALKGNRTVNWHAGKKLLASFCFSNFISLVKSGVNIDLERLYFSFLESYLYGQMELRFRLILSSTWSVSFHLFQRAIMEVHPTHPEQAC